MSARSPKPKPRVVELVIDVEAERRRHAQLEERRSTYRAREPLPYDPRLAEFACYCGTTIRAQRDVVECGRCGRAWRRREPEGHER